ncbi:uncharacterized protein KRP23_3333 [Phytophthora ramorum]|uniref:uncharacterized protein n=1 Tax=Phytophthora ramorum TaxID=164328 RepID=UPI00309B1FD4|nr:hypothetical protein KRP23_3333 [Phytophthora ramorum]
MQAPAASLRLRLLEPCIGVVSGGTRLILHGVGFRPAPHSLTVRFRVNLQDAEDQDVQHGNVHVDASDHMSWTSRQFISNTVDVGGRFLLETQLECVLPSFERQAKRAIAARTSLAASSASVNSAPQLVPLSVEVILNGGEQRSNALTFKLHQPLEVRKVSPQSVLMASPAVVVTATLNILKLPAPVLHRTSTRSGQKTLEVLEEMNLLPVFIRVRQASERTGAVSEQTREGRWKLSPLGVYEVEFDAATMGFGAASVDVSLNRVDFFQCRSDSPPEGYGYRVHRDVLLRALEPACVSVTSGQVTEVRVMGDGFVDTGDIVVALSQKELPAQLTKDGQADAVIVTKAAASTKAIQVAQLNATYFGKNEIRCTVPANLPFGCTSFSVSLNGGRQFGKARVVGLLYRDRALQDISPASSSLSGGTQVTIRYSCLPLEDVDAFYQLQRLDPPRRIRVRIQPISYNLTDIGGILAKSVLAEASPDTPGVLICRTPNFLENIKALNGLRAGGSSESDGDSVPYMWRFTVGVALGNEVFQGALPFSFYLPPVIRSLTQHHGPSSGDTCVKLRMKHKVPPKLKLLIRFSTLDFAKSMTIDGRTQISSNSSDGTTENMKSETLVSQPVLDDDPDYLISCQTPLWTESSTVNSGEVPHLTIVQVSYDSGVTFFPVIDPPPSTTQPNPLAKDLSYLCFLFYPPPIVRTAIPLSADILGGSYIRLQGEHIVDHGAQPTVVFESAAMSRKVSAFVEKGELRCCAPPFNVGLARVFVSLNGEQYTFCELHDPETNAPLEFIFYSSPTVTRISPLCACVRQSSELRIFGTHLIETDRIKVRISFPNAPGSGRRLVFKDVPGRARDGVITATTPTFSDEYANQNAQVDVALNGADFSGTSVPLRYFSRYSISRVDPPLGAFEVPVTLTVYVTPVVVTDHVLVRIRLSLINTVAHETYEKEETDVAYGPVEAGTWTSNSISFTVPPLSSLIESLLALTTAHVELSFDGVHFHAAGNLRDHYHVYNMPQLTSATPLFGVSDRETKVVAHGVHMRLGDVVKLTLFLESPVLDKLNSKAKSRRVAARAAPVPVVTVIADVNVKRQRLSWTCPSLVQLRASPDRQFPPLVAAAPTMLNGVPDRRTQGDMVNGMLLPERVVMQISVVDGQPTSLPFVFRYYRAATLVAINPRVGYVCSGSLVSFEFAERIATPTVDFRFGESLPMTGRIREERFVECFSPELSAGSHCISISFNEQHFEPAVLIEGPLHNLKEDEPVLSSAATFHAFPLPVFVLPPADRDRVYAFGPTSGGTVVVIKGMGFVPATKIYVRFASQFRDAFDGAAEIIVSAKVVDNETIKCISPPSNRLGRVALHVSYNLQQYSDSTCFFEYHAPTRYVAQGTLCGPISGQTPLHLLIQDTKGLPSVTQLLQCAVRFESEKRQGTCHVETIDAQFDMETRILSCITPAWSSNELVGLRVSLSRGDGELFEDTRIKFLFYDPPEGVIKIEPAAGPLAGGTEVLAWCGSIVETGEVVVSIQLTKDEPIRRSTTKRTGSKANADADLPSKAPKLRTTRSVPMQTLLVKGEIVGEAVRFVAPRVEGPCTAILSISLNGIDYTSSQPPLHFTYYVEPILRRINPGWAAVEGANDALVIEGDYIRDFGCNLLVRFSLQDGKQPEVNGTVVGAHFISNSAASATGDGALQCVFPAAAPGFYELEVSLNGQQFSQSLYVSKTFGNLSGTACTALLPFRHFSSPFCLATATGPAAGGSTVVLFLGERLLKILSREAKCQVQFTPVRGTERVVRPPPSNTNISGSSPIKASTNASADVICMLGEIDHVNARVTCRAPLLRVACVSLVDILLPSGCGASAACQLFGVRQNEREKYYSYESPSITEIAPSCGPTSGATQLVIEGANILDTAQIFVRFRSSVNEREFVLVPARYSRTFPEFSNPGSVKVFFSPNAQQFVYLGELLFHPAMAIKDELHHTTFRFCSNVGGSPFSLQCSPSTVLRFMAPGDITTAEKKHLQIQNLGLRKGSEVLKVARSKMSMLLKNTKAEETTTIQEDDLQSHSDQELDTISTSSRARLVLSASVNFQTLLALSLSPQIKNGPTVTLECTMPPLSFSGPATLVVSCGGVVFSNAVTVHCYDPRSWRVLALSPSCGQLPSAQDSKEPLTLHLRGENFVENRKIIVRVADKDKYFTTPGKLEQVHLLSLRIAAVKNLRSLLHPLGIGLQSTNAGASGSTTSSQKREEKYLSSIVGGTTGGGSIVALVSSWSTFTFTLRIECGDQRVFASCREVSVLAAVASGSVLSWEEEFELRVAADRRSPLLITAELTEPSLPKPLELAQAWIPLNSLLEGSSDVRRFSARLEEHFKRGNYVGSDAGLSSNSTTSEVELLCQLSPLILHPEFVTAQIPYPLLQQLSPQTLDVQVSSGDGFYSTANSFLVYKPPTVIQTTPSVLPRSAGGDVVVTGSGFVNSGRVCVRLFAFKKNRFKNKDEEQQALASINRVKRFQRTDSTHDGFLSYFTRDVEGTFVSATSLKFRMPAYFTSYNIFYSVSFDGLSFTEASQASNILMFSISAVTPKGGPISGNTYSTLHGTNIDACLSSRPGLTPLVRVTWKRGARDLEHVMVPGEHYPHEDAVYFYSPQSKFGLCSIAVNVELSLIKQPAAQSSGGNSAIDSVPRFGRDEVSFVMYKTPTIKSVAPLTALVSGLSTTEVIVQGFEEKAVSNMKLAPKLRFKRRGQMQVSDAQLVSETRFECVVPRFNVTNAIATELPASVLLGLSPNPKLRGGNGGAGAFSPRRSTGPPKLWTRASGIFVALLGARNLRASKKNACNPFAVVYVGKAQLKSTRKDGAFNPVWNELFDFEWVSGSDPSALPTVRVVLESQLTADQSESLGHVEVAFPVNDKAAQPFALRAWFPLRRIRGKYARKENEEVVAQAKQSKSKKPAPAPASSSTLGEVELAIAFLPPVAQTKKHKKTLRPSLISVISTQPQSGKNQTRPNRRDTVQVSKREKLLRAFRQRGAPASLVPTELAVELALNGQDFWSIAPSTCYSILTPIVLDVEPKFICIAGGSVLYISGNSFINTGCLRVAFAVLSDDGNPQILRSERTVIVEAKYRSSSSLVCTTPPLFDLAAESSYVNVYVSLNGTDFDSVALPKQFTKLSESAALLSESAPSTARVDERIEESDDAVVEEPPRQSPRKNAEDDSAIALISEQYVVDCKKVMRLSLAESSTAKRTEKVSLSRPISPTRAGNYLLVPQIRVYLTPKIVRVRPTDGVYTSHLTIDGTNFTNTNIAIARFTSLAVEAEVRTAKLVVVSSTRMECSVPDFPRGVIVRIAVAMNGVEFVQCPGELRVFQSPRLTELFPSWISTTTTLELELRGINLTAAISSASSDDNNRGQGDNVQVSFSSHRGRKVVRGVCEDGQVRCPIPKKVLQVPTLGGGDKGTPHPAPPTTSPILVDIWLGGKHNAFTGSPLPLHVYREIPTVHVVSPMDGPVYGGFAIVVEGRGFIDTGKIVVRFQLYLEQQDATPRSEDDGSPAKLPQTPSSPSARAPNSPEKRQGIVTGDEKVVVEPSPATIEPAVTSVDVVAKFISAERVLCPAPSFPQEGVYKVLVALNSVEFSRVSDGSWFLAWQNWQKRKRLLSHALFSRATAPDETATAAAIAGAAAASASLDEDDIERLRRKSSFMLPKIKSTMPTAGGEASSASFKFKSFSSVSEEKPVVDYTEEALSKDPRLLQWHPTSTIEARVSGRPLLSLLEYLCGARETQQFICRRLTVAFRLPGAQPRNEQAPIEGASIPALRFPSFVEALRLVFPNALMRDLEELWHAAEHRPDGSMTLKQLLRRLLRNADQRSSSPEPGPTHYDPRYGIVSSRESAAIIFPPVVQSEHISDPPSALFIDYDAAVQTIKPRPPRPVFRKRKFNTSWCNPVVEGAPEPAPPSPRPPSTRPSPRAQISGSEAGVLSAEISANVNDGVANTTDTVSTRTEGILGSARSGDNSQEPQPVPDRIDGPSTQTDQGQAIKEDAVRAPRTLAQATVASNNKRLKSPRSPRATTKAPVPSPPLPVTSLGPTSSTVMPRQTNLSGPNPFYDDIAPLYAKFLNSTEVKRFLKQ